ncbi:hypothetical protein KAH27_10700 [bacterium]|nr:hypothetical protein [bacterium]
MRRKKIYIFLMITMLEVVVVSAVLFKHNLYRPDLGAEKRIAAKLHLTDICLSTESRHTRNIAFPLELCAPFQDIPGYFDHFPSSTFIRPQKEILFKFKSGDERP